MRTGKLTAGTETAAIRITVAPVTAVLTAAPQTVPPTEAVIPPMQRKTQARTRVEYCSP